MNRVDMIGRCIESVVAQGYENKEHVIIDGASTDGTVDVIREYADRYPHIRWISESDRGLSEALNKGLKLSTGDIIGVLGTTISISRAPSTSSRVKPRLIPRPA